MSLKDVKGAVFEVAPLLMSKKESAMGSAFKISEVIKEKSGMKRLTLTDFRNYESLRLEFDICPIVMTGKNGSGKTNILEAVSFLSPGRGLRGAKMADIRRLNASQGLARGVLWAVSANVQKNDEDYVLSTAVQKSEKEGQNDVHSFERRTVLIDGQKATTQAELGKYFSAIWLTPQMDRIFLGGPQPRRSFLDRMVYAFDLEHAKRTATFEHLYKEWYRIIKSGRSDNLWLLGLEEQMAAVGVSIAAARRELVARLNTFTKNEPDDVFPDVMLALDGKIEQMLDENAAIDVEDFYKQNLYESRKNVFSGDGVEGVNKTDFKVFDKKKQMPAELCSTGEQKLLLISIILAQTKCQMLDKGFAPVLLLDEVTAHLDSIKRNALLEKIKELRLQAFITATDEQIFKTLKNEAQFFEVKSGVVSEKSGG
ncbi:MAG: DNA replication/repair protein RecF [Alphaproteobacteria bacterium]|nr:DNA replication/repair protein RecF [Alphaproteobacteria bacterium]